MTMTSVAGDAVSSDSGGESRWTALISGPSGDPRWERPALLALLTGTAVLYLWGLGGAGWTNQYYAAAVQSGTQSWQALLFGSLDPQNFITVDKPPAAMWVMGLSGRIFGFNSWSMLAPEALMGVAAVALLVFTVRRWAGPSAGLLAGLALAVTPVAAMMFRYDNPDALLTLVLVAAAYCTVRAVDASDERWWSASTGWLVGAGVLMGLGFLTKMMQAFLVLPGLAGVILIAGAGGIGSRIVKLLTAGLAVVVSSGWYVALIALLPASSRPYIGGSTDNSLWELAVDYNGLGRIFGNGGGGRGAPQGPPNGAAMANGMPGGMPTGGGGGMPGGMPNGGGGMPSGFQGFGSHPGVTRLFTGELATEFSWLFPAALLGLVAVVWITRRSPRTDPLRAATLLWGGWLIVTAAVLSYMSRSFHSYYSVMLAPAIAASAAIGITQLWLRRAALPARLTLAAISAVTGVWAFVLLDRTPDWLPWLRWTLAVLGLLYAALLLGMPRFGRLGLVIGIAAVVSGLIGPTAYAVETVAQPHSGGSPVAGPGRNNANRMGDRGAASDEGLDDLLAHAGTRWAAAAVGASDVSAIELRTGAPLMAVGGFSGRDNAPTLEQFQQYVAAHEVGYYLVRQRPERGEGGRDNGGAGGANANGGTAGNGGNGVQSPGRSEADQANSARITAWVKATFPESTVGTVEVYNLQP